jgi:hypothetical protein
MLSLLVRQCDGGWWISFAISTTEASLGPAPKGCPRGAFAPFLRASLHAPLTTIQQKAKRSSLPNSLELLNPISGE